MKEKVIKRLERRSDWFWVRADEADYEAAMHAQGGETTSGYDSWFKWDKKADNRRAVAIRYERRANRKRGHICTSHLKFEAELGAPGIGYSYKCTKCGRAHWTMNKKDFIPFSAMNPEDVIGDSSYFM